MHTKKKGIAALVAVMCALVTLAIGGVVARAAGDNGWQSSSSLTGDNTLTITVATNDAEYAENLKTADAVVDVYQIGTATKSTMYDTYDYVLTGDFATSDNNTLLANALGGTEGAWQQLANTVAEEVDLQSGTAELSDNTATISGLNDGIYLVLVHGSNVKDECRADGTEYSYSFTPIVVALPTKEGLNTATMYGDFLETLTVSLKFSRATRYGALTINKTVTEAATEDSTFVFHITGTTPANEKYDNYASVTIPAGDLTNSVTITHIPAGTEVTVTEEYAAGRYSISSVSPTSGTIVAEDDPNGKAKAITFACKNTPDGTGFGGHGVQNKFTYTSEIGGWDNEADPASKKQ